MNLIEQRRALMGANIGGMKWDFIGEEIFENVSEWTSTTTADTITTSINISNTDYAWILVIVTFDTPLLTSNEWGITIGLGGRYTSNSAYYSGCSIMQKGVSTIKFSDMVSATTGASAYGVTILNNSLTVSLSRKCHGTGCPKIRGGNYTVKAYGMKSL